MIQTRYHYCPNVVLHDPYKENNQDKLEQQGKETGIRKFREKIRQENGSKLIVLDGGKYAIFDAYEIVILRGRNVRSPRGAPETIEKKDILINTEPYGSEGHGLISSISLSEVTHICARMGYIKYPDGNKEIDIYNHSDLRLTYAY